MFLTYTNMTDSERCLWYHLRHKRLLNVQFYRQKPIGAYIVFQMSEDAERFYKVLPKRLEKHGLKLHEDKSSLLRSGRQVAKEAERRGERIPTYKFLGFTVYWGKSRKGFWRLKFKSRADRFTGKLKGLREYLRKSLNQETKAIIERVKMIVKGWVNYHAISDNQQRVSSFILLSERALFNWINRKGGKRKMNWTTFGKLLQDMDYPHSFKTTSMFNVMPNNLALSGAGCGKSARPVLRRV